MLFNNSLFYYGKKIAQLGKNYCDGVNEKITGEQLLQAAIVTVKELQYMAEIPDSSNTVW